MKFQPATFLRPSAIWLGSAAAVLLAGEAGRQATWPMLAAAALAALGLAFVARMQQGLGERRAAVGLAALALGCGIAAGMIGHTKLHSDRLEAEAADQATAERDRLLGSAIAAAKHTADLALDRVGNRHPETAPSLDDLVSNSDLESAVAVIAGDTVIAVAGPHRLQPVFRAAPAALVSTPFARMLVIRETRGARQAQVVLLLDSLPGLPVAGRSLASAGGADVVWNWNPALDQTIEFTSNDAAIAGVVAAMRAVAVPVTVFLAHDAATARQVVGAGLLVLALVMLLTATEPAIRAGAILIPLWALARTEIGIPLFGPGVMRTLVAAAALFLMAIVLWRRPARRTAVGLAASVLLLGTAPPLVVVLARALVPRGEALSLSAAFGWQLLVAVATAAALAVAAAPLRGHADEDATSRWGIAAIAAAVMVALVGIEAWAPGTPPVPGGWAAWYLPLWLLPIALLLPRTTPRVRLMALATTAGVLASLATWATSLDRRVELAAQDLARLNAEADTGALAALDRFAVDARRDHATRLDLLYAAWRASPLARDSIPTYLSLWSAAGRQREFVALDSLSVSWNELDSLVMRAGTEPQRFPLARRVGHHEVLILPLAPDTIATVTIGPRSRLLVPTTFGLLVGWRAPPSNPPFRVFVPADPDSVPNGRFHRYRRYVTADVVVTAGDPATIVRAEIEMLTPVPFLVRSALGVLLDVGVILGLWLLLRRLLGERRDAPVPVFRQSYRRTVAAALMAFFIVPAIAFTLTSILRLQREARRQHEGELADALRTVVDAGGLPVADARRPRSDALAFLADSANAEVGVYRQGRLLAASDSMLAELGLMPPIIGRSNAGSAGSPVGTLPSPLRGAALRLGVITATTAGTELVVALPGADTGLAAEQIDQALMLLLVALGGIAASMLVAGIIARALGQPIETLRRTAVAIGRHESPPLAENVPDEFGPVFDAISQMQRDLRSTEAELQAGRARTAAILSTVATGVIGVDGSGAVMHVNPRAAEMLGRGIALGEPLIAQLPDGWRPIAEGIDRLLGRATRTPENRELQVGQQRVAVTLAPLGDGGLVLAITDITEAARAARVLAWGEMARQVAHEIKNPLTPMRLGLQHLRRVRSDGSPDFGQLVDDTAERLLGEIDRLDRIARSFARYGAPPEQATPLEPLVLRPVIEEIASLFALGAERMRIEVTGETAGPVQARREELVQVLLNLLDNSRQAGASVVRLVLADVTLRIEDDGRGIPEDQLVRIFEPSFSTTTSGTGLGLAIVRRLVEGWGASVAAESRAGGGAVFTVRFAAVG